MRRYIGAGVLWALCVGLCAGAPADKKKADGPPVDSDKLSAGQYTGKLLTVPGSDRAFRVRVEVKQVQPNGRLPWNPQLNNLIRLQNEIQLEQARMAVSRNPAGNLNRLRNLTAQYEREQALLATRGIRVGDASRAKTTTKDIDFQAAEKLKVRTLVLPEEFDEKGKLKKPSPKELARLKGKDRTLPGYESSPENLEPGQTVRVTLVAVKKPTARDKDVAKEAGEKKMQVKLIMILKDSSPDSDPPKKGKK